MNIVSLLLLLVVAVIAIVVVSRLRRSSTDSTSKPLLDERVRLALNHALDRQKLMAAVEPEREFPEGETVLPAHDPQQAARLLTEAGFGTGLELNLALPFDDLAETVAVRHVIEDLGEVGVSLRPQVFSAEEWSRRAVEGSSDGRTLFYGGFGLFFVQIGVEPYELNADPANAVRQAIRDLANLNLASQQPGLQTLLSNTASVAAVVAAIVPMAQRSRRRMSVWMREDGAEALVGLVAWWPGLITVSRTNYASSIADLVDDTLDSAVDEGACYERLEIMSHGNRNEIRMGSDSIRRTDFDAAGAPATQRVRRLLEALKAAMCPTGTLIFTACDQDDGLMLRNISRFLQGAIRVSGYSETGYPDGIPLFDFAEPDLHFINGSTASAPP